MGGQANKQAKKTKNILTYEKMKSEESSIKDGERTISNLRTNNDEESQAPKRKKVMPAGTQAKGKEMISQESRHKKHNSSIYHELLIR